MAVSHEFNIAYRGAVNIPQDHVERAVSSPFGSLGEIESIKVRSGGVLGVGG